MQRIALHTKALNEETIRILRNIYTLIEERKYSIIISDVLSKLLAERDLAAFQRPVFTTNSSELRADYLISMGGDGTILESVTYVQDRQIPILGINTGRLGFLAQIPVEEIAGALRSLFNKQYSIESRALIQAHTDNNIFGDLNFALNEFAVLKRDSSSMIVVHTYIDGERLNSYWADGLLVSTPTGSTGYCLSVGGPIVMPGTNNFIVSPVCPHNLNVRPLIIPDSCTLGLQVEGRSRNYLASLDSRSVKVEDTTRFELKRCSFNAQLIRIPGSSFFDTLRQKMNWGLDNRN